MSDIDELVRDIMKVPYSKHYAKEAIKAYIENLTRSAPLETAGSDIDEIRKKLLIAFGEPNDKLEYNGLNSTRHTDEVMKAIDQHYMRKFEKMISEAKPEENSHGDAHPYSSGYNVALDEYEANLRNKLKSQSPTTDK